eukprot:TRINITY_DN774126_c0_g1_i1.p1 TRINITY_DN774126_c0_g1~~TRINITY_DN774126_c0_g1_i1.p1  ORF type:complete len:227 (+),score=37.35 TRINITY_DN774126_c0_g1_i1:295-975(+)
MAEKAYDFCIKPIALPFSFGDYDCLPMELCRSSEMLFEECRQNMDTLQRTTIALLKGLSALHAANFIHSDIKPSNIMVLADSSESIEDNIRMTDFGNAIELPHSEEPSIVSTLSYRAPEVIKQANCCIGPACDVWSLGCCLVEKMCLNMPLFPDCDRVNKDRLSYISELLQKGTKEGQSGMEGVPSLFLLIEHKTSKRFAELVWGMLKVDPASRLSAKECLNLYSE